ncbi:MAG: EamA-like transporter family [Bacteroidota bacterium]|jgi:drug/metabolite transporter (DMT)-like permease
MGILFVLIGALCFAVSNAYWKKVTQTIPYQIGMFYRGIFASIIFSILYFGFRDNTFFKGWTVHTLSLGTPFLLTIALSVFNIFGLVFFLRGIQKAPVSIVVPVSAIKLFTILTAVFIVGEVWKANYLYAFIFSTAGLLLLYFQGKEKASVSEQKNGMLYGVLASFFWGSSYALYTYPISWWGPLGFSLVVETTAMLFGLVLVIRDGLLKNLLNYISAKHIFTYLKLGFLLVAGGLAINISYQYLPIMVINILIISSQLLSVLIGYFFFKERLSPKQWMGLALIIISFFIVATSA